MALNKIKAKILDENPDYHSLVMDLFSQKVDGHLLNSIYFRAIKEVYERKIRNPFEEKGKDHNSMYEQGLGMLPKTIINFDKYMEVFMNSGHCYDKLIKCLSEWMALMELSDDLLERLELYGHSKYFFDLDSAKE